ncbi:hypothetical protein BDP27DRAFT_1434124 [Rhodocollybia butyracea]|uniref:Uncharacterized protein n=1 Tax=Rhodocollybia butyracea TaxID=206335 RepID=A0A9P5P8W5_9AGAR|nr:hypothetical protein BDP27DRAFT_1434124 [Rhodocollybia butyracea]
MSTVWFVVDDTDSRLSYSGSDWSFNNSTDREDGIDAMSMNGPAFNSTLHRMTGNGSISFQFNGSGYLGVYGTIDGDVGPKLPNIECSLDGVKISTFSWPLPKGFINHKIACRSGSINQPGIFPGAHKLSINITNLDSDWYFDYITYESLVNPVRDGEILQAGNGELLNRQITVCSCLDQVGLGQQITPALQWLPPLSVILNSDVSPSMTVSDSLVELEPINMSSTL